MASMFIKPTRRKFLTGLIAAPAVILSQRAWSWRSGRGLVPPWQASEFGLTRLARQEEWESLNAVDLNDTRNPGYLWYTHNFHPAYPKTPPSSLSIVSYGGSNSVLRFDHDPLGCAGYQLGLMSIAMADSGTECTPCSDGTRTWSSGRVLTGETWTNPWGCQFRLGFDETTIVTNCTWVTTWMPITHLEDGRTNYDYGEIDMQEWHYEFGNINTAHRENYNAGSFSTIFNNDCSPNPSTNPLLGCNHPTLTAAEVDYKDLNLYTCRNIPAAMNGGTGMIEWWIKPVKSGIEKYLTKVTYSQNAPPNNRSNHPNGTYYIFDRDPNSLFDANAKSRFHAILSAGYQTPTYYDFWHLWTP